MPPKPVKQTAKPAVKRKKTGSIEDFIEPISFEDECLRVLLYGESGTGKTTFWGTFPGPILAIVCSGGNRTGELRSLNTPEMKKKVKRLTLDDSSKMAELIPYLQEGKFKTVVLDHVSGLQDLILKEILGLDELPAQKHWGLATQQQYGQCTQQTKEYCRALLNLNSHIVIIGQERTFGGREEGFDGEVISPTRGVAVTPSLAGWLNPACDYVLQAFKRPKMIETVTKVGKKQVKTRKRGKGVEYCLRCEPHDIYYTKFRIPRGKEIPDVLVDPSYDKLAKLLV